jgi:hypothetical protein
MLLVQNFNFLYNYLLLFRPPSGFTHFLELVGIKWLGLIVMQTCGGSLTLSTLERGQRNVSPRLTYVDDATTGQYGHLR